jgi:hypothetical protein
MSLAKETTQVYDVLCVDMRVIGLLAGAEEPSRVHGESTPLGFKDIESDSALVMLLNASPYLSHIVCV